MSRRLGGGPYRQGKPMVRHVCLLCMESYSDGPSECHRCKLPRTSIELEAVYEELLREGYLRIAAPRWSLLGGHDAAERPLAHLDPPHGRSLEDLSPNDLVDWLQMKKC